MTKILNYIDFWGLNKKVDDFLLFTGVKLKQKMPVDWVNGRPEDVFGNGYNLYVQALRVNILQLLEARKPEITEWMQANASWTDRTGNARRGLNVDVTAMADGILLTLGHGVTYGIFLEVKDSGKFAILTPALDYWGPIILKDLEDLVK